MRLSSPALADGDRIPDRYTCAGEDLSPPLEWRDVPEEAASVALLFEEPEASVRPLTLWAAWGIPAADGALAEGEPAPAEGRNDYGATGYRGPCPPPKDEHRYVFRLYALDVPLDLQPGRSRRSFDAAIEGHVLGTAELSATFARA